jgi:hypothetical protein
MQLYNAVLAALLLCCYAAVVEAATLTTSFSVSLPTVPATTQGLSAGQSACSQLKTSLSGKYASILQQPLKYAGSRDYWNTRQDFYTPTCAVYPTTANDVSTALKIIKSAKSRFAIKAGGHNPNDFFSSVNNGVLIDLVSMNNKSYDANAQTVTYGPGE